ncbi:MAG: DegT/DnrJ/EryC1/StrS family aminotransferase [Anaerolineae bacterium]|nr:DegT/DnrJ/EryC1/StrS family aminotransferase [Anaerolineae bacterium]
MIPILDLKAQYTALREEIHQALDAVLESGNFVLGPDVRALEEEVAAYCGCAYGVGVASGTDALRLCFAALGIGPGDEVITTPFTFVATANTISRSGATPVFVDIDPLTYNLDPEAVAAAVTPRTKAIVPVHLYGQPADMDPILEIAERYGLAVIEDAAQAIGAEYKGRRAGSMGLCGCLSFYPTKNLGAYGDAGMVVTNDPALAERVDVLRRQGGKTKYYHDVVGFNSRLDTVQAAILRVKLRHLERWQEARRQIARRYDALLADLPVTTPYVRPDVRHVYHQYTIRAPQRDALVEHLQRQGIGTMIYYPLPLHRQKLYADLGLAEGSLPHSEAAAREVLSLPMYPELTAEQQVQIASAIAAFYGASLEG